MFSSPTAIRVLKKQDPAFMKKYDLSSLRHLFLAGEPLDEPTHAGSAEALGQPVIDHYWQTETGWPMLSAQPRRGERRRSSWAARASRSTATTCACCTKARERKCKAGRERRWSRSMPPLPPGCMSTVWGDDERFVKTYFRDFKDQLVYSTFDWGIRDEDGYYFILGRTDDVINVAGHRLGTREIEEAVQAHPNVAECAVVGVSDPIKGQMPLAFAVLKDASKSNLIRERRDGDGGQAARRDRAAEGGATS